MKTSRSSLPTEFKSERNKYHTKMFAISYCPKNVCYVENTAVFPAPRCLIPRESSESYWDAPKLTREDRYTSNYRKASNGSIEKPRRSFSSPRYLKSASDCSFHKVERPQSRAPIPAPLIASEPYICMAPSYPLDARSLRCSCTRSNELTERIVLRPSYRESSSPDTTCRPVHGANVVVYATPLALRSKLK